MILILGKRAKQGVNNNGKSGMHYIILTLFSTYFYLFISPINQSVCNEITRVQESCFPNTAI